MIDGALKTNLPLATVRYNTIVGSYLSTNMSSFSEVRRNGSKYPIFLEILYSGKTLFELLSLIQNIFRILSKVYISISNNILIYMVKLGWILLPIFLIISYWFYRRQSLKCQILLKLFFVLPKEYLL